MAIPDYQSIMMPLLKVAADGQDHTYSKICDYLAQYYNLTDEELKESLPNGRKSKFVYRVGVALKYLVKAGLLDSPRRGAFAITERGLEVYNSGIEKIDNSFLRQYPEFVRFQQEKTKLPKKKSDKDSQNTLTPKSFLKRVLGWISNIFLITFALISWAVAGVLGKSLGMFGFIIFGFCFLIYWLLGKIKKGASEWYRIAVGAQAGQLLWFVFIGYYTKNYNIAAFDIIMLTVGTVWFFLQPKILSSVLLLIYQMISLIVNVYSFGQVEAQTQRFLVAHILLRSASLAGIIGNLFAIGIIQEKYRRLLERKKTVSPSEKFTKSKDEAPKSLEEKLFQLKTFYEKGLIGDEEYKQNKTKLIDELHHK